MKLSEIERIPASAYPGGKEYLSSPSKGKIYQPLPGGSGLAYSITGSESNIIVKIYDPKITQIPKQRPVRAWYEFDSEYQRRLSQYQRRPYDNAPYGQVIGKLILSKVRPLMFPMPGALQVETITVDEERRGQGIGQALYGVVLSIMKRPLIAGNMQTPDGRASWARISQIPGVEVRGYVGIREYDLDESDVDIIMGRLGGQYIGQYDTKRFFAFDVKPNATGKELEAVVKTRISQIYGNWLVRGGLYAVWTGK